jgi:serine/threonine protein kinase
MAAMQQLLLMQQSEKIVPPKQLRPSLPEAAQMLILNALAFDPKRRPQDARIFTDDLARALTGEIAAPTVLNTNQQNTRTSVESPAQATAPQAAQKTQPQYTPPVVQEEVVAPPKRSNLPIALGAAAVAALIALGIFAFFYFVPSAPPAETSSAATSVSERVLTYSITLQKDPQRYPGSKPFQLPGEVIFSPGDRVRFSLSSPQPGHLYIINESPLLKDQAVSYNVLFPSPTSNNGSTELVAGQTINIPESGDGFIFDQEEGTEKLWLVWANNPIPELEAVKRWANLEDKGEIKDAAQANALRGFLAKHSALTPEAQKDDAAKQTTLKSRSEILVKAVNLEHH